MLGKSCTYNLLFINASFARSALLFAELIYDVVFQDKIKCCRMFGMLDENERRDRLVPGIYPRSLLYFVSGVVEGEVDMPIIGMQRYLAGAHQYRGDAMGRLRAFLSPAGHAFWSVANGATGLVTDAIRHGDFDNDPTTVRSVQHLPRAGFKPATPALPASGAHSTKG